MHNLSGKYRKALVTGASSGLGQAFTSMLVADGIEVWTLSRRAPEITAHGPLHHLSIDLAEKSALASLLASDSLPWAEFDILINNAGSGVFCPLEFFPVNEIEPQLQLMLETPIRLSRKILPYRIAANHGAIVNVASLAARFPLPFHSLYNTAKAGLSGFSRSLMDEVANTNVAIVDFQPGDYQTPFNAATHRPPAAAQSTRLANAWRRLEQNLANGPRPEVAAIDLKKCLLHGRSRTFRSGSFFQTAIAPIGQSILPDSLFRKIQRGYFKIDS